MSRLPWRRARLGASVLVALALALAACTPRWAQQATADRGSRPTVHACQVCGEPLAPTERTATRWARTERLFTCAGGHEAWIPEPESPRS